jgi:hypothetical protein
MANNKNVNMIGCPAVNNLPCGWMHANMLDPKKKLKVKNMVGSRVINNPNKDQSLIYADLSAYYKKNPNMAAPNRCIRDDLFRCRGNGFIPVSKA